MAPADSSTGPRIVCRSKEPVRAHGSFVAGRPLSLLILALACVAAVPAARAMVDLYIHLHSDLEALLPIE